MRLPGVLLAGLLVAACGGGGGDEPRTAISIAPQTLSFSGAAGDVIAPQIVNVHFKGSGVVVGYAPGVTQPSWLSVTQHGQGSATDVSFSVSAHVPQGLAPGQYSVPLRFVTGLVPPGGGLNDATDVVHTDATIRLTVIDFSLHPESETLHIPEGATEPVHRTLALSVPASAGWTSSSSQSWLALQPSQGQGPASPQVSIASASLSIGSHSGVITVFDSTGRSRTYTVSVVVSPPKLTTSPGGLVFDIAGDTSLAARSRSLTISDELGGAQPARALSWTLAPIGAPWLSFSLESGSSSPPQQGSAVVSSTALAGMANGTYTTTLKLAYRTSDNVPRELHVPVTLNLNSPLVRIDLEQANAYPPLAGGSPLPFRGIGTYGTGYRANLTQQLAWSSSAPDVAAVGNTPANAGTVRPLTPGAATIKATHTASTIHGSADLAVSAPGAMAYVLPPAQGDVAMFLAGADGRLQPMATPYMDAGDWPTAITFGSGGSRAYVLQGDYLSGGQYGLLQYSVGPDGHFAPLTPHEVPLGGGASAMTIDASGRHAYTTGYCGGSGYCVQHLAIGTDGALILDPQPAATGLSYSTAIAAHPSLPYVYRLDFDGGAVQQYATAADGSLTPLDPPSVAAGAYPISMAFSPAAPHAYVANFSCCSANTTGTVSQYDVNGDGTLGAMAVPSVLAGKWPFQIIVDHAGTAAYMVYRASDPHDEGVATFSIDASGSLVLQQDYGYGYARNITLDPAGTLLYLTTGYGKLHQLAIGPGPTLTEAFPPVEHVDGTEIYVRVLEN